MLIPGVQAAKPQKVTLMVDDVPVAQVLQALAEQEKLNLVVSPDVSGTVSLHLIDFPLAFTEDLQPGGINYQVCDFTPGGRFETDINRLCPPADTAVIRAA